MALSTNDLGARFLETWRLWTAGGTEALEREGPQEAAAERRPPGAGGAPVATAETASSQDVWPNKGPRLGEEHSTDDLLWHQVTRGEGWAELVARYNIADPQALLAVNGLQEPRALVPGEWVCLPCDLVRPVWEITLGDPGEKSHG